MKTKADVEQTLKEFREKLYNLLDEYEVGCFGAFTMEADADEMLCTNPIMHNIDIRQSLIAGSELAEHLETASKKANLEFREFKNKNKKNTM